jgi:hypothetical protein
MASLLFYLNMQKERDIYYREKEGEREREAKAQVLLIRYT